MKTQASQKTQDFPKDLIGKQTIVEVKRALEVYNNIIKTATNECEEISCNIEKLANGLRKLI